MGGVVRPREDIVQITPLGDELFVESQLRVAAIANVISGQTATIKFSAYDYNIDGKVLGKVLFISANTFRDERHPNISPH